MVDEHSEAHTDGHPEGARPAGDAAAAPEELRERFDEYVAAATANAAQDRVRVILSTEDDQ